MNYDDYDEEFDRESIWLQTDIELLQELQDEWDDGGEDSLDEYFERLNHEDIL